MLPPQLLVRRREVARILALSEAQVRRLERTGALHAIQLPDIGSPRFSVEEVERLAGVPTQALVEHGEPEPPT